MVKETIHTHTLTLMIIIMLAMLTCIWDKQMVYFLGKYENPLIVICQNVISDNEKINCCH